MLATTPGLLARPVPVGHCPCQQSVCPSSFPLSPVGYTVVWAFCFSSDWVFCLFKQWIILEKNSHHPGSNTGEHDVVAKDCLHEKELEPTAMGKVQSQF